MAPRLYHDRNNGVYYAVMRRRGKLIRNRFDIDL